MTNVQDTANQQIQTAEEVRQQLLAHLDASKEIVSELSSEELEAVSGGGFTFSLGGPKSQGGGSFDQTHDSSSTGWSSVHGNSQSIGVIAGPNQIQL